MHAVISLIAQYAIVLPVLVVLFLLWRLKKPQKLDFVIRLVATAFLAALLTKLATTVHQDPRPFTHPGVVAYFKSSTDNGFPSDHTVFSAVIAFVTLQYSHKLSAALFIVTLLIGSCRIIAHVHHLQDIVAGFVIASISYLIVLGVFRFLPKRAA